MRAEGAVDFIRVLKTLKWFVLFPTVYAGLSMYVRKSLYSKERSFMTLESVNLSMEALRAFTDATFRRIKPDVSTGEVIATCLKVMCNATSVFLSLFGSDYLLRYLSVHLPLATTLPQKLSKFKYRVQTAEFFNVSTEMIWYRRIPSLE